jgi:hypothetical protein
VGTLSPALGAYAAGNLFSFVAPNTNTGASTINLNSLGAKSITKQGSTALVAGDIVSGRIYLIEYDGTRFQLINPSVTGVTSFSAGSTGLTPSSATTGAVTLAGTLATTNGGTGLTSFTANQVFYASSTSAFAQSGNLLYSGTDLTVYGITVGRGGGAVSTNTAVGASALAVNSSGARLTAVGSGAMAAVTSATDSVAFGTNALALNTTGSYNSAFGREALGQNTTGGQNTAIGEYVLGNLTTASDNTGVGYRALQTNTTGASNVAIGRQALQANTTANDNTAVGYQALYSNTTGTVNTAIGGRVTGYWNGALYANTTGNWNVALGSGALQANTTASNNTGIGGQALLANTTGASNVAIGKDSLYSNTTASYNTAVGYQAGYSNTTGAAQALFGVQAGYTTTVANQTFIGSYAGYSCTTGSGNTAIGALAGYALTTGEGNTFVGGAISGSTDSAGRYVTTGSKNTILGRFNGNQGGLDIRTSSNYIVLSDGDGNPRGIFDASGNLLVGATSTTGAFDSKANFYSSSVYGAYGGKQGGDASATVNIDWHVATSGNNTFKVFYTDSTATLRGSITYNRTAGLVAYNTMSDYRAKDIYGPITDSGALIDSVPVYMGKMKGATQERPMFIAHETPAYAHTGEKDAVDKDGNPVYQQMDAAALVPVMWAEIQSLRKRLATAGI